MQRKQFPSVWLWCSLDTAIAAIATLLCLLVVYGSARGASFSTVLSQRLSVKNILLLTLFTVLWTGIHQLNGLYRNPLGVSFRSLVFRAACASALGSVFFLLFPLFSEEHKLPLTESVVVFFATSYSASLLARSALRPILPRIVAARQQRTVRILIIGSGPIAGRLFRSLHVSASQSLVGFVDLRGPHTVAEIPEALQLGDLGQLEQVLMSRVIDEVLIALPLRSCYDQIKQSIQICERAGVPVSYHFEPFSHRLGFSQVQEHAQQHYISWRPSRLEQSAVAKRIADVLIASVALILVAPVFLIIAVAIKLCSRGPVFFTQERYGLNKQRFRIVKFRTMVIDAEARQAGLESQNEAQGPVFKIKNDPRITPVGRFLRKTSLDELPQFINVLKGEMSLVGPRPLPLRDVARFTDACLMRRFSVKPGLTCLWQIRGRSNTNFDQWIAYDLEYIDNWSPFLDFKILMMTIPAVIRGQGAV
jgi:exopolysaccharide biosynthesis polyprenyl glycosylphosphotransferase